MFSDFDQNKSGPEVNNRKRQIEKSDIQQKVLKKIPKMETENVAEVNVTQKEIPSTGSDNEFASDLHGTDITKEIQNGAESGIESIHDMIDQIDQNPEVEMSNTGSDENGRNSDEDAEIDLTDKVKNEEMNIGRNIIRRQIFIPEVTDINWNVCPTSIRLTCSSKDKKFNKEHNVSGVSDPYYFIKIEIDISKIETTSIVVHNVRRKSFELEFRFKPGHVHLPPPAPPVPPPPVSTPGSSKKLSSAKIEKPVGKVSPFTKEAGYTGLANLGNTCFMASVLQCLSNVRLLRDYFLSENFRGDINEENALGTGGQMANAFYYLLTQLWSGKHNSIKPTKIKDVVGERAQQFQGYSQHDAQEFCTFILDLLHEDVNLVKTKPYVEAKEAEGRPDKIVAQESWDLFKARNKSKIVDLFYGQYKSKLVCPKCERDSITFDPFVYLSVPMPRETRKLNVLFFFANPDMRPRRLEISISKSGGSAREIFLQAARLTNIKYTDIKMIMEYKSRINEVIDEKKELDGIQSTDSLVLSEVPAEEDTDRIPIGISHRKDLKKVVPGLKCHTCNADANDADIKLKRCNKCRSVWYCSKECQTQNWKYHKSDCKLEREFIGIPIMISLPKIIKRRELHELIQQYSKYSILYEWDDASIEKMKNYTSDYETPPSSPENPIENGSGPITITEPPFRIIPTTQIGIPQMPKTEFEDDANVYNLTGVEFLTIEWLNDRESRENNPCLSRVESVSPDNIKCDLVPNYEDTVTLERCIELFSESEILEENDLWYCSKCKEHVAAQKQISLWRLPKVLVFHLKRFQYKAHQYFSHSVRREKLNKLVEFELSDFDMSPFCLDPKIACDGIPPNYDLIGVVNHMGSMSFGHYTARVRHPDNPDIWRLADDSHVSDTSLKSIVNEHAYLLFYRLREDSDPKTVNTVEVSDLEGNLQNLGIPKEISTDQKEDKESKV